MILHSEQQLDIKLQEKLNFSDQQLKVLSGIELIVSVTHGSRARMLTDVVANFFRLDSLFLNFFF